MPTSPEAAHCELCGVEIEFPADLCDRHAMTHEQSAEMMRRVHQAIMDYRLELWPELSKEQARG